MTCVLSMCNGLQNRSPGLVMLVTVHALDFANFTPLHDV